MVGLVSNNGLGLFDSSMDRLGTAQGQPTGLGQAKGSAYVNIATGNLSVQFLDESLSGTGADLFALRTYNSQGGLTDGDADGWRWSGEKKVVLNSGTAGAVGSSVKRTLGDGSETVFSWDTTKSAYVSKAGSGAHDTITWNAGTNEWVFKEDGSNVEERYNGTTGWIKNLRDASGNGFDYTFSGDKLSKIVDLRTGQTLEFTYGGNGKLSTLSTRTTATGTLVGQVHYAYDGSNRLSTVKTDLTPNDNSIADNNIYTTTYTYDGTSTRIASIAQSDGTSASFTYDGSGRISTVTDQMGVTTFAYDVSSSTTIVKDGNNNNWAYVYDATTKQLKSFTSSIVNGVGRSGSYTYDADGNVKTVVNGTGNTVTYTYDANGNRTKEMDTLGNTLTRTFGSLNQVLTETRYSVASVSSPGGAETTRYVYDSANRLRFVISAEGRVSETRYNTWGLVSDSIQYSDGIYTAAGVAEADLNTWVTALTGTQKSKSQRVSYEYDARGNLSKKTAYATVNTSGAGIIDNAADITKYTYSEYGQLLQTIVVRGTARTTETTLSSYGYDGMGRQTSVVNEAGTTTTTYSGVTTTVSNAASGLTVVSTTDALGRLTSLTSSGDSTNRITKYYYDNAGQLRMTEDPTGARSYLFYDHAGRVIAKVDPTGAVVGYTHDKDGRVLTETRYANKTNPSGWFNGTTITEGGLSIGTSGTQVITDAANDRKTTYTYDVTGRLLTTTVDGAAVVTNTYDGASRLIKTQQGDRITRYFYDADGRQIGVLNAERNLTETVYDAVGRATKIIRYDGQVSTTNQASGAFTAVKADVSANAKLQTYFYYDAEGRQVGVVNEQGFLSETVYDAANNQSRTIQYKTAVTVNEASDTLVTLKSRAGANTTTTTTQYDSFGRLSTVTTTDGTVSRNVYDTAGRLIRQIAAEGTTDQRATRTRYNAFGEVTGVVSGVGEVPLGAAPTTTAINTAITNYGTVYEIDAVGRKVAVLGPVESGKPQAKTFLFYNTAGQLTYTVNALGEVSKTTYNSFGQATEVRIYTTRLTAANLATITTGGLDSNISGKVVASATDTIVSTNYNKLGLVSSQTDAEGFVTTNTYTTYGQLYDSIRTIKSGVTTRSLFTYDLLGRVRDSYADYGGLQAKTSVTYDGFGRTKTTTDANGKVTNTAYTENGRTITVTDPLSRTSKVEIDALGRTLKSYDGFGKITSYTYDDANRKITVTTPENISISTWKTRTGETLQVQDGKGQLTTYSYTKDGQLDTVKNHANVVQVDNTYDNSGRLYESKDANGTITRYTYDAANRVVEKAIDPAGLNLRTKYDFDGQGRQILVTEGFGTTEASKTQYIYDRKGQISQIIVDPDTLKLSTKFTYDGLGQTTKVEKGTVASPSQQVTEYTFDKLGRKTKEVVDPGTGTGKLNITTQYRYDANGNLTRVIDAKGNSTWFVYNNAGEKVFDVNAMGAVTKYEYDKNGKLHHTYQYTAIMDTTGYGDVVTQVSLPLPHANDRRSYSVYDDNGRLEYTLNAVTDTEWTVTQNVYDANGNVIELWAFDKYITSANIASITGTGSTQGAMITVAEVASLMTGLGYSPTVTGNARVTKYQYDVNNRQTKTILPGWYDPASGRVQAGSASGRFQRTIEVTYDAAGNAVANKIRTGAGSGDYIYQYKTYDKAGREINDIDALGYVTQKTYYATGEVKTLTRSSSSVGIKTSGYWTTEAIGTRTGRTINYEYDDAGRQTKVTQPSTANNFKAAGTYTAASVTDYQYDALGNLVKQSMSVDNAGIKADTYFYYDAVGRRTWVVDPEGYGTETQYDALGNVDKVTEFYNKGTGTLNSTTTRPTYTTDAQYRDRITDYTYDNLGRVKTTHRRLHNESALTLVDTKNYTSFDDVKDSTDAMGNITRMEYNRAGQMTKITEPGRVVASTGVDVFKSQVTATPTTTFFYNAFGESTKEVRSTNAGRGATITVEHFFDLVGNEIQTKDALGNITNSAYDVSGKVIRQTQAISVSNSASDMNYSHTIERRYEYDKVGRQTASLDVYGNQQTGQVNVYNGYGEVTAEYKVWGSTLAPVSGAKVTSVELMAGPVNNAIISSYLYDAAGRVQYKITAEGYTHFFYDLMGNVTRAEQRGTNNSTTGMRVTQSTYNKLGKATEQRLPNYSATTTFGSSTTALQTPIINRSYDRWGNVLSESGATPTKNYTYNQDNKVLSEEGVYEYMITYNGTAPASKLRREFQYNDNGQLIKETQIALAGAGGEVGRRTSVTNTYNAAGQLTSAKDATNVTQQYAYDSNGNRVGTKNGAGHVTVDEFNANGQITKRVLLRNGATGEYTGSQTTTPTQITLATYQYDQAGRKYWEGDASGNKHYYRYDERGNIIRERNRVGGVKTYEYDELGHKTKENEIIVSTYNTYPNGQYGAPVVNTVTTTKELNYWSYKIATGYGADFKNYAVDQIISRKIAANSSMIYDYQYNTFGQMQKETLRGTSSNVTYNYWENGLQKSVVESTTQGYTTTLNNSTFYYDNKSNRTVEHNNVTVNVAAHTISTQYGGTVTVEASSTSTGNLYSYYKYDALNRLSEVKSPSTTVNVGGAGYSTTNLTLLTYSYDEWGNRRRIKSTYTLPGGGSTSKTEWYAYDAADRVTVEGGISTGTTAAAYRNQGIVYKYDTAGRRVSEEAWSYSQNISGQYGTTPVFNEIYEEKVYAYNDLGLVANIQARYNTRSHENNSTGTATYGALSTRETNIYDNRGFKTKTLARGRTITSTYNADGNLNNQTTVITSNGRKESVLSNYTYDSAGNVLSYRYWAYDSSKSTNPLDFYNTYSYSYVDTYAGRQASAIGVSSTQSGTGKGITANSYDSRGRLVTASITEAHISDSSKTGNSYRKFAYNTSGHIIMRAEKKYGETVYKTQNYYYSPTGGELANLGQRGVDISPLSAVYKGGSTPGSYTVNEGDTLMGISQMLFGDAKYWYLIADANGLTMGPTDAFSGSDIGRTLRIPNSDKMISNTSNNWKPYNASEIIGDLTPNPSILPPPKKSGCGIVAMIIMVVVAVVLTVVTAGAAAMLMAGQTVTMAGAWAAGTAVMTGGAIAGTVAAGSMAATLGTVGTAMVASFVGGTIGSLGSQIVGKGLGVVDNISMRQAFGSGLTAAFAAGAGSYLQGAKWAKAAEAGKLNNLGNAARGAASYLGAHASNKIVGLETHFNWTDLAVASISSGITGKTGNSVTDALGGGDSFIGNFAGNLWGSTVNSSLSRLAGRGEKQDWASMAADAFGNALATKIIDYMKVTSTANYWLEQAGLSTDRRDHRVSSDFARDLVRAGATEAEAMAILNEEGIRAGLRDLDESVSGGITDRQASARASGYIDRKRDAASSTNNEQINIDQNGEILETVTVIGYRPHLSPGPSGETITQKLFTGGIQLLDGLTTLSAKYELAAHIGFEAARGIITGGPLKSVVTKIVQAGFEDLVARGAGIAQAKTEEFVTGLNINAQLNIAGNNINVTSDMFGAAAGHLAGGAVETFGGAGLKEVTGRGTSIREVVSSHNAGKGSPRYKKWVNDKGHTVHSNLDDGSVTYIRKDGVSVTYRIGEDGIAYPDFSPHAKKTVTIDEPFSRGTSNYKAANKAAGLYDEWGARVPEGYRWHHHEDSKTMMLLPKDIHDEFSHYGGVSKSKN